MGIILEKSKLMFDELIGSNSFDEIFKNSIRDYYTYGFKSYDQFLKGSQIIKKRWKVFCKVLGEKWYFEKRRNGRNQITLKTAPVGMDNPVDDLYFLHNLSKIGDYLNYLLDLDERSSVRGGLNQLPVDLKELETVEGKNGFQDLVDANAIEYAIISNWEYSLEKNDNSLEKPFPIRINRQLNIWSPRTRYMSSGFQDKYANLSNRTEYLYELGVLGDLRDNTEFRNQWLKSQWEAYDPNFKKYFASSTSGNHYWYKSPLTINVFCQKMLSSESIEPCDNFVQQLRLMCDFFSQYYPLGELGTILSERLSEKKESYNINGIRFKHNYLQKTLYDYNLIDILIAIENRYVCLVEYSHGTNLKSQVEIVVPLEIRISVINGREYIFYYHITQKKIKALRLEFIDKISVYSHVDSIESVQYSVIKHGKKIQRKEIQREGVPIDDNIAVNVNVAYQMLPFIWGTEVPKCCVTDDWKSYLIDITLPITYESEKEQYIKTRLNKERRNTKTDKRITAFPTKEFRNWIRSFYKRIDISPNEKIGSFDVTSDVEEIWNVYFDKCILQGDGIPEHKKQELKEYTEYSYIVNGDIVSALEGHGALFNELFSRYTVVLAESVLACSSEMDGKDLDRVLIQNIKTAFDYYSEEEVVKVKNELKAVAYEAGLFSDLYGSRFVINGANYLSDVLPLTKMELRWLRTVLRDPLAKIFLSTAQLSRAEEIIDSAPYKIVSFPMETINYFDRYNLEDQSVHGKKKISQEGRHSELEISFIKVINQAICSQEKLRIEFRNWKGEKKHITCSPVWIEYSRRDDIFRLWCIHKRKNEIRKINVSRILNISIVQGKKFNMVEQRAIMKDLYDKTITSIKVEFFQGNKNLPDRLLTEFSLWKKKCIYDVTSQKYTMILYYSTLDEKEVLIRLLSYGPYIRVVADEDNYVLSELKKRIMIQRDMIRKREFKLDRE